MGGRGAADATRGVEAYVVELPTTFSLSRLYAEHQAAHDQGAAQDGRAVIKAIEVASTSYQLGMG